MMPVLNEDDRLLVVDCPEPRPGDVILFSSNEQIVAHRVMRVHNGKLITQGDNNPEPDSEYVQNTGIMGRVDYARNRDGKLRRIYGGRRGRITGFLMKIRAAAVRMAVKSFGPLYLSSPLAWLQPLFSPWTRIFIFPGSDGDELQFFLGGHNIGTLRPGSSHWKIRRPFRLIYNDSFLSRRFR